MCVYIFYMYFALGIIPGDCCDRKPPKTIILLIAKINSAMWSSVHVIHVNAMQISVRRVVPVRIHFVIRF